jgi:hypothetical protein
LIGVLLPAAPDANKCCGGPALSGVDACRIDDAKAGQQGKGAGADADADNAGWEF